MTIRIAYVSVILSLMSVLLFSGSTAKTSFGDEGNAPIGPAVSLTLIPPSPVTDKIELEIRGAVRNRDDAAKKYEAAFYLDEEKPENLLYREIVEAAAKSPAGVTFRLPTKDHAGRHRVILVMESEGKKLRDERPLDIIASDVRSTRRFGGAWVDIYHYSDNEAFYFNAELAKMTDPQWRELVRAMHETDQNILVITMMFQFTAERGHHTNETKGYPGKAFYPSKLYSARMPIASQDPLETILDEADKHGMHVMPGVGNYAFRDYSPGALRWCKQVASELWERYGHHPSFYGWYMTPESDGSLGSFNKNPKVQAEAREEIVNFFKEFTPYVRGLAPDKPVMLAPNCWSLRGAEPTYRKLLPNIDIVCPFAYQRMPKGDLTAKEAIEKLQALCDEAGCHLWMDMESFLITAQNRLIPRPIEQIVEEFQQYGNFEKVLHYQFPGLMSSPKMSRQPGGAASVKLYEDYRRYWEGLRN